MFRRDEVGGSLENCKVMAGLEGALYTSSETVETVAAVCAAATQVFHLRSLILPAGVLPSL